jgi:ribosome-binding ATPase
VSLNCGIIGLPNVGKSTIFSAMTTSIAEAENYPFCTIEPNIGIVPIDDFRLQHIAKFINPKKIVPTAVEFVDIAGLVKGASKGEGLGNQFLDNIRNVDAIIHVVRCFNNSDIAHVNGRVDPVEDIEVINIELALADLEVVTRRLNNIGKLIKSHDPKVQSKAKISIPILEHLKSQLSEGISASSIDLAPDELETIVDLNLITLKDVLYVCNIDEASIGNSEHPMVLDVINYASRHNSSSITVCGQLEAEIALLPTINERQVFIESSGLSESTLNRLVSSAYHLLGLRTFFTTGEKEVRAWLFRSGACAVEAAGAIHSDFQRGFIKAEIYHYDDLMKYGSEQKIKESGKMRMEGRDYLVQDGEIIHFRFNIS